jgi:phosphate transport system permease protein
MAPWVLVHVELPLHDAPGFVPLFAGVPRQTSMLSAALVLAVMILPTLAAISRDVIRAASGGVREAAMALGATWWETTWKVVLPAARGGIFGAVILALGRALGETIAVTMVIGNRPELQPSLFAPAYTLASVIANEFTEATGALYIASLIALGLILIVLSLLVNVFALAFVRGGIQGGRVP